MAALPDEVVEKLSTIGPVKLVTGPAGEENTCRASLAPLHAQLYVFVLAGGPAERNLLATGRAEITAEDPGGDWTIRVSARAVAGRSVLADPRRPELMHWLPEGVAPASLLAVRLHPEKLEYLKGKGTTRVRAAGPIPGAAPPPATTRWSMLATDGVLLWMLPLFALDWGALLLWAEADRVRGLLLVGMAVASLSMLGGVTLWNQVNVFERWREGLESDAAATRMLTAWEPVDRVRGAGLAGMGVGLVLAVLVGAFAGWRFGVVAIAASGLPLLAPFHWVRHAFRRSDRTSSQ